jgi:hypothetical protein
VVHAEAVPPFQQLTNTVVRRADDEALLEQTFEREVERLARREDGVLAPSSVGAVLHREIGLRHLHGPLAGATAHDLPDGRELVKRRPAQLAPNPAEQLELPGDRRRDGVGVDDPPA